MKTTHNNMKQQKLD